MITYSFLVTIEAGNDEFWSEVTVDGNSGCDKVRQEIIEALQYKGFGDDVCLVAYSNKQALA